MLDFHALPLEARLPDIMFQFHYVLAIASHVVFCKMLSNLTGHTDVAGVCREGVESGRVVVQYMFTPMRPVAIEIIMTLLSMHALHLTLASQHMA